MFGTCLLLNEDTGETMGPRGGRSRTRGGRGGMSVEGMVHSTSQRVDERMVE